MIEFLKTNTALVSLVIALIALIQPWLVALWKKFYPKIGIHPSGNLEIGYSILGPTVALHGTLQALHVDVFVKRIRIKVKKVKTKEEHWFEWMAFHSPILVLNPKDAPPVEIPAGFIVSRTQPHRYHIVFSDPETRNEIQPFLGKLCQPATKIIDAHSLVTAKNTSNYKDTLDQANNQYRKTQEYNDAYNRLNQSCYWQADQYGIEIHIDTDKGDSKFTKRLTRELAQADVDRLRLNAVAVVENLFRSMTGEQDLSLNFIYPAFKEIR